VALGGGDAILFKFNDGAPFIVPEPEALLLLSLGAIPMLLNRRTYCSFKRTVGRRFAD
jgi:hypothetical protein